MATAIEADGSATGAHGAMLAHAAGAMGSGHGARSGAVWCDDAGAGAWCRAATGVPSGCIPSIAIGFADGVHE